MVKKSQEEVSLPVFEQISPAFSLRNGKHELIFDKTEFMIPENELIRAENELRFGKDELRFGKDELIRGENEVKFDENDLIRGENEVKFDENGLIRGENGLRFGKDDLRGGSNDAIRRRDKLILGEAEATSAIDDDLLLRIVSSRGERMDDVRAAAPRLFQSALNNRQSAMPHPLNGHSAMGNRQYPGLNQPSAIANQQ